MPSQPQRSSPGGGALDKVENLGQPKGKFGWNDKPKEDKKSSEKDEYDDDWGDDDIDEILPDTTPEPDLKVDEGVSGSQSMGLDPSVNTLAMDEYDYIEEVIKDDG